MIRLLTGFPKLDEMTNGLQPSDMIVVSARPSMCKTEFCFQLALDAALEIKIPTVIYSLEMAGSQLMTRMLSGHAQIHRTRIQRGRLDDNEIKKILNSMAQIASCPLFINECSEMTLLDIRNDIRRLNRRLSNVNKNSPELSTPSQIGFVVIDYLQLVESYQRFQSEQERVSDLSRVIKAIAREFSLPIIVLSQ